MKNLLRIAASIAVVAIAAEAVWMLCVRPYQCDVALVPALRETVAASRDPDPAVAAIRARNNLPRIYECLSCEPYLIHWQVIAATSLELAGRDAEALAIAENASRWDRRPELFVRLGELQAKAGQHRQSVASIARAVLFNPTYIDAIENGLLREAAHQILTASYVDWGNLVRNGDFSHRKRVGGATAFTGNGQGPDSVARHWFLYTQEPSTLRAEMLPNARPGGKGNMMHVVANGSRSALVQVWGPVDRGPSAAKTSAWIRVMRGTVRIGSGPFGAVSDDAAYTEVGTQQWRRLEGRSTGCPVAQTVIGTMEPNTEFYVAEVEVHAIAGAAACEEIPPPSQ
jgi:hypothetical protein